jgi:hypothetical protein
MLQLLLTLKSLLPHTALGLRLVAGSAAVKRTAAHVACCCLAGWAGVTGSATGAGEAAALVVALVALAALAVLAAQRQQARGRRAWRWRRQHPCASSSATEHRACDWSAAAQQDA